MDASTPDDQESSEETEHMITEPEEIVINAGGDGNIISPAAMENIITRVTASNNEQPSGQNENARNNQQLRPRQHISINYNYTLHYPEEYYDTDRAVEYYGAEYVREINRTTLEEVEEEIDPPVDLDTIPNFQALPDLVETRYFFGKAGVEYGEKYIPDAKYKKHFRRKVVGTPIDLCDLHHPPEDTYRYGTVCNHVAIIGPTGCGKTMMLRRYAKMVLNRQVPALQHIDVVHFMDASKLYRDDKPVTVANMLLERMVVLSDEKIYKYGIKWITKHADRVLFIFDGVADIMQKFTTRYGSSNYQSKSKLEVILLHIITGHLFKGCTTLISAREWAWKEVKGDGRPQRFVVVQPMTEQKKLSITRSIFPGREFDSFFYRRFPMAFQLFDDVMYQYFGIAVVLDEKEFYDKEVTSDVVLVSKMIQLFIRSFHSCCNELEGKVKKLKPLSLDLMRGGVVRFSCRDIEKHKLLDTDMVEFVTMAPKHPYGTAHRLYPGDFSYHFSNQVIFEYCVAAAVTDLSPKDFQTFINNELHTDQWVVVRRILCGILFNKDLKDDLTFFVDAKQNLKEIVPMLKSSLENQLKNMLNLSPFQRYELLASLHECGQSVGDMEMSYVKSLMLPGVPLSPSDLYFISQIEKYIGELQSADLCLENKVELSEFEQLLKTMVQKCADITLDIARITVTLEHVDMIKNVLRINRDRKMKILFLVSKDAPDEILNRFPVSHSSTAKHQVGFRKIPVTV